MGYHVTILRTKGGEQDPITWDEVARALATMDGRLAQHTREPGALELHAPGGGEESEVLFFDDGELWTKNPGEDFTALMIELADKMGARVRGDEYETYRTLDDPYTHPDDEAIVRQMQEESAKRDAKRNRWKTGVMAFRILAVVGLVAGLAMRLAKDKV